MEKEVIHSAGLPFLGKQYCFRCGEHLSDYTFVSQIFFSRYPLWWWKGNVAVAGSEKWATDEPANCQAAQQSVHLTALRRWLTASILFNVILLAMLLVQSGGR